MSRLSNELLYVDDKYGDQDGDDGSSMLQMQRVVAQKKAEAPAKRKRDTAAPMKGKGSKSASNKPGKVQNTRSRTSVHGWPVFIRQFSC